MTQFNNITKTLFAFVLVAYFIIVVRPWDLYFLNDDFVHIPLSTKTILIHFEFFRPVPNLITSLEVNLFGTNATGFHFTSIILHLLATFCVVTLCKQVVARYGNNIDTRNAGFIAGCLFLVYPFHSEPTMWIIGRIAIIATIFSVASIIFFLRKSKGSILFVLSIISFILSLFTYETSWVVPGMITVFAIADNVILKKDFKSRLREILPFWVLLGLFLLLRYIALDRLVTEYEFVGRNKSIVSIVANLFRLVGRTLVPPATNSSHFVLMSIGVMMLLSVVFLFLARLKKIGHVHIVLATLIVLSYLPVLHIGIDTHGSEGERYLYFGSMFWIILLTVLLYHLRSRIRMLFFLTVIVIYSFLLAEAASNYRHASEVAKHILSLVRHRPVAGKLIAINIPSNYKGALIFRSGFPEAVQWIHGYPEPDSVVVMPAQRTYKKTDVHVEAKRSIDFKAMAEALKASDKRYYRTNFGTGALDYDADRDIILYFTETGNGTVVYPPAVKR